ncbi:Eukaryotic translation initiation factor 4E [Spironucleus salmonicida]|uniref:Eukaryotic translation initiation factor 4E n=1 Tax=Spironucleus salmonicida TaxID=348837 RepID=V6LDQ1_9EUKA|nr:Eukaryotic translation initiation factor 4E [Spironucleus salmonicida]|eukprot:EST42612.1 Eukaryotic translation initiation factor 4E [Spironucleus salmonicida]
MQSEVLEESYQIKFMVKLRKQTSKETTYRKNDFKDSFVEVSQPSNNIEQLVTQLKQIPTVNERQRGILTIFRKGIEPLWEDPKNQLGSIIRFSMFQSNKIDPTLLTAARKYVPVVEDQQSIFLLLFTIVVTGQWKEHLKQDKINGIYFKTDMNTSTFEIWCSGDKTAENLRQSLIKLLDSIGIQSTHNINDVQTVVTLADTVQITNIKGGITRGKSLYNSESRGESSKSSMMYGEKQTIMRK